MNSITSQNTKFVADPTYRCGCDFGVITCARCNVLVRYGTDAKTRPKYCPGCEESERNKLMQHCGDMDVSQLEKIHLEAARMPMPKRTRRTLQQVCSRD